MPQTSGHNAGVSIAEQRRFFVEPAMFTILKRGGAKYGNQVECIVYLSGHLFRHGNELLPYRLLIFKQS